MGCSDLLPGMRAQRFGTGQHSTWGVGEWVGILTPRFSDSVMYRYDKQRPDSAAARGEPVG